MVDTAVQPSELVASDDGIPLKVKLARATRRQKIRALLLVAPLGLFVLITFVWPITVMLTRSVHSPELGQILHRTTAAMQQWNGEGVPDEAVFEQFVQDVKEAGAAKTLGKVATRFNFEVAGTRSLFFKTNRKVKRMEEGPWKEAFIKIDKRWDDPAIWSAMKRLMNPLQTEFYVSAFDSRINVEGSIESLPDDRRIYLPLFWRTLIISGSVTLMCLLLGYPLAYWLSVLPLRISNLLMILVLLPFWTSLLVRTTAWIALLQTQGIINDLAVWVGIIGEDNRMQLIFNATGTTIAMTHILLPFMILPLYSVMRTIPPSFMRAARSLGADQVTAFRRVYMPQTVAGVGAGSILVFILAIGYYITPALVGGQKGTLISNMIAYHMQSSLNWGLAAALGTLLLLGVLALYWLYNRLIGVDNMKFG
ncbi:MAG: ABC transporter permease [Hyphomicrobiales bacterium]